MSGPAHCWRKPETALLTNVAKKRQDFTTFGQQGRPWTLGSHEAAGSRSLDCQNPSYLLPGNTVQVFKLKGEVAKTRRHLFSDLVL